MTEELAMEQLSTSAAAPTQVLAECPKCHQSKDIANGFGYRITRGRRARQSWCTACRGACVEAPKQDGQTKLAEAFDMPESDS